MVIGETEAYISTASKEAIKEYFVLSVDVPFEEECTHALAREEWEKYLSRIEIEDPNKTKNSVANLGD